MRKNNLTNVAIVTGGDMSGNVTSAVTDVRWLDNLVMYLIFTGTPTGVFAVEVSPDQQNWFPLALVPSPIASGSAGNHRIELNQLSDPYIRAKYTATSGSGSLTATISGKML